MGNGLFACVMASVGLKLFFLMASTLTIRGCGNTRQYTPTCGQAGFFCLKRQAGLLPNRTLFSPTRSLGLDAFRVIWECGRFHV